MPVALGQIRRIDPASRVVVVALEDGPEVTLTVPPGANVEVVEPCTLGTMGGTLADLKEGYWVDAAVPADAGSACECRSLVCLS